MMPFLFCDKHLVAELKNHKNTCSLLEREIKRRNINAVPNQSMEPLNEENIIDTMIASINKCPECGQRIEHYLKLKHIEIDKVLKYGNDG